MMMPTNERWRDALAASQAELRRFAEAGPTKLEVETGVETLRSRLRGLKFQSQTRISPLVADQIVEAEFSGRIFQHPTEAMRVFDIAAAGLNADDVKRAFARDWKGSGPLLVATAHNGVAALLLFTLLATLARTRRRHDESMSLSLEPR